jgi:O-methyltransferase
MSRDIAPEPPGGIEPPTCSRIRLTRNSPHESIKVSAGRLPSTAAGEMGEGVIKIGYDIEGVLGRVVRGVPRRAARRALLAAGRFEYYVQRGMYEPYEPLDMSPFETPTIPVRSQRSGDLGRRYNQNLTNYVRWGTAELLKRELVERDIGGAVAEVGVGYGDFAWLLNYYFKDRRLYLFDTFSGFDSRDQDAERQAGLPQEPYPSYVDISPEQLRDQLPHPDMVDLRVGWFPQSALGLENETFAFVHVDVGLHGPTLAALEWFYPRLSVHGYLLVADYNTSHTPGVKRAVRDFTSATGAGFVVLPDHTGTAVFTKQA